jgi:hypothetical protein
MPAATPSSVIIERSSSRSAWPASNNSRSGSAAGSVGHVSAALRLPAVVNHDPSSGLACRRSVKKSASRSAHASTD